jgi:hypothetical protein
MNHASPACLFPANLGRMPIRASTPSASVVSRFQVHGLSLEGGKGEPGQVPTHCTHHAPPCWCDHPPGGGGGYESCAYRIENSTDTTPCCGSKYVALLDRQRKSSPRQLSLQLGKVTATLITRQSLISPVYM